MTESTLKEIVRKAVSDAAFRRQLRSDPGTALAGISLTSAERAALSSGDPAQLTALGVDQRASKAYSAGFFSEASKTIVSDPDAGAGPALADENTSGATRGTVGDPAVAAAAAVESPFHAASDYQLRMTESTIGSSASVDEASYTSTTTRAMLNTESTIDTGSTFEPGVDATTRLVQTAEGNIDTGAVVDPSIEVPVDAQVTDTTHITDF